MRLLLFVYLFCFQVAADQSMLVKKQHFTLPAYTTVNGQTIAPVNVGWEAYGQLNKDKSNAILITHYFTGNSHAAGVYSEQDSQPGYWDAIIGPNKAIDTNKYFVISVDSLANISPFDPNVITTGPATVNPQTGKPYGLSFPVVQVEDFVAIQKQLLEALGIEKLHAVIGASMGAMQATAWAVNHPEMVNKLLHVIGSVGHDIFAQATLARWSAPIILDPAWQNGHYALDQQPKSGLVRALMNITQDALHYDYLQQQVLPKNNLVTESVISPMPIVSWLSARAEARSKYMDANSLLYLVRASQLFLANEQYTTALQANNIPTLFLPADNDLLLIPQRIEEAVKTLNKTTQHTNIKHLAGPYGHLNGVVAISQAASDIKQFLEN